MQHSAQQRSATHTAEHTRAQEHTGSTAAHSRARPASSCMHTAHSTAQLQHITIAVTKHAVHNSELIQIDKSCITISGRAERSTQLSISQGTAQEHRARESTVMCGRVLLCTTPQNKHSTGPVTSYQSTQHILHNTQRTARAQHMWLCSFTWNVYHSVAPQKKLSIQPVRKTQKKYD